MAEEVIIDKDKDIVSVQDKYLYYLLNGGDFNTLPIPVNRQDKYLYLLCLKRSTIEEINVSEWLYGNGDPSTAPTPIGADKDYYIDRETGDIYRKEGEVWKNIQLNIKGDQGVKGEKGDPFEVAKTFESVQVMNAGFATDGVKEGQFVIITNNVNNEENARLYVKGQKEYALITDLSGANGIKGDQGIGIKNIEVQESKDDGGVNKVTITLSNGATTKFDIKNGSAGTDGKAISGTNGADGKTWRPNVDQATGKLTWTMDNSTTLPAEAIIKGADGETGNGIKEIQVKESNDDGGSNVITIVMTDGTQKEFTIKNGSKGNPGQTVTTQGQTVAGAKGDPGDTWKPSVNADGLLTWQISTDKTVPKQVNIKGTDGVGIETIEVKESDVDGADNVVTIKMTNGTTKVFNIKNGSKGDPGQTTTTTGATVSGPPGKDGSEWFSGATEPSQANLTTAVDGDYYLQSDGRVWKKTNSQWEDTKISLKGATGEKGEKGDTTTSTGTVVNGKDGKNGQTYVPSISGNTITWKLQDNPNGDVTFKIEEEITIGTDQPTTKVWIDTNGN